MSTRVRANGLVLLPHRLLTVDRFAQHVGVTRVLCGLGKNVHENDGAPAVVSRTVSSP
jgi:hypothetical protein